MEMQRTENSQDNLKEEKVGGFILPYVKTHSKVTEIKIDWYWGKQRLID